MSDGDTRSEYHSPSSHKHFSLPGEAGKKGGFKCECNFREEGGDFPCELLVPCPMFVHMPMSAARACKNHFIAVDMHHAIWMPSTYPVPFLSLKFSTFMSPFPQEGARNSFSHIPLQLDRGMGRFFSNVPMQNFDLEDSLQSQEC